MNTCTNCNICKNLLRGKNINYNHGFPANYVELIQDIDPHTTVCKILDDSTAFYNLIKDYTGTKLCYVNIGEFVYNKIKYKNSTKSLTKRQSIQAILLLLYHFYGNPNAPDNKLRQLPIKNIAKENLLDNEDMKLIETQIINTLPKNIKNTEKKTIINSRIGQENFRKQLIKCYGKCVLCDIKHESMLKASHIKPWSDSNNTERLDLFNGFLLCANHDALFDKGLISFDDDGYLLISKDLDESTIKLLNLSSKMKINILKQHKKYLKWHREHIFIK